MQASAAPPACGGPPAGAMPDPPGAAPRSTPNAPEAGAPPTARRSAVHRRKRRSIRGRGALVGQRRRKRRSAQRRGPRERSRRQRSAAQSGGGSSRVFLRQGPGSPSASERSRFAMGFLRFLPALNNPSIRAAARRRAASKVKNSPESERFGLKAPGNGTSQMPELDFRAPRLFVDAPLREGERIALERNQSNYLGNVLRLSAGETILVFNGRDGEWQAQIDGPQAARRPDHRRPDAAAGSPARHRLRLCAAETCPARLHGAEGGRDGRLERCSRS